MIKENKTIEKILKNFKAKIGKDFQVYKNHIYRIFNFALILDDNKENIKKYAIAAAFHDLGIWTHSFDYLEPSITLAVTHLKENNEEQWIDEISLMIDNHHKISKYKDKFKTVEVFRKADWIDVTNGVKKHNLPKQNFKAIKKEFTNKGFHLFLVKQSLKWFVKHPLNPLPMFKR